MVRKCLEENCEIYANFNLPNEQMGIYCKNHKKNNMINVNVSKCKHYNCKNQQLLIILMKVHQYTVINIKK